METLAQSEQKSDGAFLPVDNPRFPAGLSRKLSIKSRYDRIIRLGALADAPLMKEKEVAVAG